MRNEGKIAVWNDDRGFGFIAPDDGGAKVFAHISSFSNRNRRPVAGDTVSFLLSSDNNGRTCASEVAIAGGGNCDRWAFATLRGGSMFRTVAATVFLAIVAAITLAGMLPTYVLWVYLGGSATAVIAYAVDKSAAKKGRWRIQESTLHGLALTGGWPGALIAQELFRHKTQKTRFVLLYWITVVANLAGLTLLLFELRSS